MLSLSLGLLEKKLARAGVEGEGEEHPALERAATSLRSAERG